MSRGSEELRVCPGVLKIFNLSLYMCSDRVAYMTLLALDRQDLLAFPSWQRNAAPLA